MQLCFPNAFKRKFYKGLAIASVILVGIVAIVSCMLFPGKCFLWFSTIPIFFSLIGVLYMELISLCYRKGVDSLASCYLICKVLKLFVSVCFITFYAIVVRREIVAFMATFVLLFFAFLIFETKCFTIFEQKLKKEKKQKT